MLKHLSYVENPRSGPCCVLRRRIVQTLTAFSCLFPMSMNCDSSLITITPLCSMDRYQGYWEAQGQDKAGQDLDGLMSIFPDVSGVIFQIRTLRGFSSSGQQCTRGGGPFVPCDSDAVVPELAYFCSRISECCGTAITLEHSYRDTEGNVTAIATITFPSSGTASFRVEAIPSRSWSPVSGLLSKSP